MSTVDEDLTRVTIIGSLRRVDLALPGAATLGELLPSILRFAGHESSTPQEAVGGWVLQRFGHDPLDPNSLVSRLGIRDGETLHLRPRDNAMPDVAFDDVIDAISYSTRRRPSWQGRHSQIFALCCLVAILVGYPTAMTLSNLDSETAWVGAGAAILVALAASISSVAVARAAGAIRPAACLAWSSVALSFLGGFTVVDADVSVRIVLASALALIFSTASALGAGVTPMAFLSAACCSGIWLITATFAALIPGSTVPVVSVAIAIALGFSVWSPQLSYRLARIQLPSLPAVASKENLDPVQADIVDRAILADRLLGSLLWALGAAITSFGLILLSEQRVTPTLLVAATGLACLMRARAFVGRSQRLALLVSGTVLTALSGFQLLSSPKLLAIQALLVVLVCIAAGITLVHYGAVGYDKVPSPGLGRTADIIEWITVMAIVPLTLLSVGAFGWIQTLFH